MRRIAIWISLTGILFLNACSAVETKTIEEAKKVPVEVIQVSKEALEEVLNLLGSVEVHHEMKVGFKIGGKVTNLAFAEGDPVKEGTVLAKIDIIELLARKEKALEVKNKAHRDLDRMERLFNEHIVPLSSFQDAQTSFISAQAELKIVLDSLENSVISAPFTGRITRKLSEAGEIVNPGTPVYILTEMDPILVKAAVPDFFIRKIKKGQKALVKVDSHPDEVFTGRIVRLETSADPLSRTFRMEIELPNPAEKLRPGLIAQVKVSDGNKEPVIAIPLDAVTGFGASPTVFVVKDAMAERRIIKTGKLMEERVEILEGLAPGDLVVVAGQEYLSHGDRVLIAQNSQKLAEAR